MLVPGTGTRTTVSLKCGCQKLPEALGDVQSCIVLYRNLVPVVFLRSTPSSSHHYLDQAHNKPSTKNQPPHSIPMTFTRKRTIGAGDSKWLFVLALAAIEVADSFSQYASSMQSKRFLGRGMPHARQAERVLKHKKSCDDETCSPAPQPTNAEPSPAPSSNNIFGNVIQGANGAFISTCQEGPEASSISNAFTTTLDFEYYVFLTDVELEGAKTEVLELEARLHNALTKRAMPCIYQDVDTIVLALSSEGEDSVVGRCPDVTPEPTESCWKVAAQTTATLSTTLSNAELSALFFGWIEESLLSTVDGTLILDVLFQGSNNIAVGDGKQLLDSGVTLSSGSVSEVNQGNIPADAEGSRSLGPLVLTVAAAVLVLLTVFLVKRRRRRQKAFIAYASKVDDFALDLPPTIEQEPHVTIVNDDDLFIHEESEFDEFEFEEKSDHDARTCTLSNCPTCQHRNTPVFIPVKRPSDG